MNTKNKILFLIVGLLVVIVIILAIVFRLLDMPKSIKTNVQVIATPTIVETTNRATVSTNYTKDTFIQDEIKKNRDFQLKNEPDALLAGNTPYESADFSVQSQFKQQLHEGHFAFIITLKAQDKGKARSGFLTWVRSLGISDTQIKNLDLEYR